MGDVVKKIRTGPEELGVDEFRAFSDSAPVNLMYCDRSLVIRYLNRQSVETLKTIEHLLPVSADQVLGSNIDVFHRAPEMQRRLLGSDRNLPHQAVINLGDEQLDLNVNAVYDGTGNYSGAIVSWDIVTERTKRETEVARLQSMMDYMPANVMFCGLDFNIEYLNPKSMETLKSLEKYLPIPVEKIKGNSVDIFHRNPDHQRSMLGDDRNLPHRTIIDVGPEKLDLFVSPIYDQNRKYMGAMVTWEVVTEKLQNELEMARMQAMVENANINIMMADLNFDIVYMNPASTNTLRKIESQLAIPVDKIVGSSMDVFHRNPSHQRQMLGNDRNLPHTAKIQVGEDFLALSAAATYGKSGEYIGPMVTWELITDRLQLIEELTEASTQLAASANELNASATQMASNSEETTGQANEAAAASEEVSKGVEVVATNTEEMQASIKEIARNANEASGMSNETRNQAQNTNEIITKLGDSSTEIGNVIKVISSIAQQTNLLALNATIEAARAGDAGRGFAVVANEVKELAKQTATATEEITAKIAAIQGDAGGAVTAIGEIGQSIDKLNDIAGSIAASVEEQMATTNEVARVVQESNVGVQSIATNVRTVSSAADQTAQGANQVLDAARGLQDLADRLQALVKRVEV